MEFRSFELSPNAPAQQEGNLEEALASKYGVSLEQARAMNARVVDAAAGEASTTDMTSPSEPTRSTPTGSSTWPQPRPCRRR